MLPTFTPGQASFQRFQGITVVLLKAPNHRLQDRFPVAHIVQQWSQRLTRHTRWEGAQGNFRNHLLLPGYKL
jgi:hypothetical protein